jgi:hypothetical protein
MCIMLRYGQESAARPVHVATVSTMRSWRAADGDRNAELRVTGEPDHRVTGDPPCSSPRRRATSTQILEAVAHGMGSSAQGHGAG